MVGRFEALISAIAFPVQGNHNNSVILASYDGFIGSQFTRMKKPRLCGCLDPPQDRANKWTNAQRRLEMDTHLNNM